MGHNALFAPTTLKLAQTQTKCVVRPFASSRKAAKSRSDQNANRDWFYGSRFRPAIRRRSCRVFKTLRRLPHWLRDRVTLLVRWPPIHPGPVWEAPPNVVSLLIGLSRCRLAVEGRNPSCETKGVWLTGFGESRCLDVCYGGLTVYAFACTAWERAKGSYSMEIGRPCIFMIESEDDGTEAIRLATYRGRPLATDSRLAKLEAKLQPAITPAARRPSAKNGE
jgi:hypothetical protein